MTEIIFIVSVGTLACLFIFFTLDDFFVDCYYWLVARWRSQWRITIPRLDSVRPKSVAILIPTWQESTVIGKMLEASIDLINYPKFKYHIFVGCYPNDQPTIQAVVETSQKFPNVHLVMNPQPGPTNKADNLNSLYQGLISWEAKLRTKFDIVVLQDAEDVVHPTSLKLFNYLIPPVDMIQLPVFPFEPPETITGFFTYLTRGTYADEFAENHLRVLTVRDSLQTFVPSAGVGTAIRREVLDELADMAEEGKPFDIEHLTEDYEFALRLRSMGYRTSFFLEGVQRVLPDGKTVTERIATREFLPNTFWGAVRQKGRWIYGITFQAPRMRRGERRKLIDHYVIYRDTKARWANLALGPGYLVLLFALGVLIYTSITGSFPWHVAQFPEAWQIVYVLSIIATAFAIERQLMRGLAIAEIYSVKQAAMAMLLPPLLPIRLVWGNVVNFVATLRAWRLFFFGTPAQKTRWAKTDHREYAPEKFLQAYKRKLGDIALQVGAISPEHLSQILTKQKGTGKRLGDILLSEQAITESQLTQLLSEHFNLDYLDLQPRLIDPGLSRLVSHDLAATFQVVPVVADSKTLVVATPRPLDEKVIDALSFAANRRVTVVLSPPSAVDKARAVLYPGAVVSPAARLGSLLLEAGTITDYQLVEAFRVQEKTGRRLGDILVSLGYITQPQIDAAVRPPIESKKA